jgi:Peptidase family M28
VAKLQPKQKVSPMPLQTPDRLNAPIDAVSGDALMQSCAGFATRMKLSGTADELASLREVQAKLDGFGFRTNMMLHDAYISLPLDARVEVDGVALTSITHSFSRPSAAGGLTAPVIDIGHGTAAEVAGRDLRGAIVLVSGIASPGVADLATQAGAVGQLHISPHEHLHEMCISPVWGSPGLSTLNALPGTVACTISLADGEALRARLLAGETPVVTLHAAVDTGWRKTPLLVAEMDGPEAEGPFVLFSGHHDTWYFGVMDNGSANATMIEAARVLAGHRERFMRGLRLCFWSGHSHGRYSGSAWYVDTHWAELDRRCAVHVNIDSTGGVGASVMTEAAAPAELAAVAADAIACVTNEAHIGKRPGRNSDMSFWGVGIPSMFGSLSLQPPSPTKMRNALGWWWHTPHDLLDKIDEANLVRDTKVFVAALWELLTAPVLPLDFGPHLAGLLRELDGIGEADLLAPVREAVLHLTASVAALPEAGLAAGEINQRLMRLSRALVPLDLTGGDRFSHDPALPQAPWPVLDPIRRLAGVSSDLAGFARVDAVRAGNRVRHALTAALAACEGRVS